MGKRIGAGIAAVLCFLVPIDLTVILAIEVFSGHMAETLQGMMAFTLAACGFIGAIFFFAGLKLMKYARSSRWA